MRATSEIEAHKVGNTAMCLALGGALALSAPHLPKTKLIVSIVVSLLCIITVLYKYTVTRRCC